MNFGDTIQPVTLAEHLLRVGNILSACPLSRLILPTAL